MNSSCKILTKVSFLLAPVTSTFLQQFQTQPLLSSPHFSFKTSQRSGRHLLVVNGVTFFRNRHRNNKQYWKCNQYYKCKCPCIVVVDEVNSRMNVKHIHNHETSGTSGLLPSMTNQPVPPGTLLNDNFITGSTSVLLRSPVASAAAAVSFAQTVQSRVFCQKRE